MLPNFGEASHENGSEYDLCVILDSLTDDDGRLTAVIRSVRVSEALHNLLNDLLVVHLTEGLDGPTRFRAAS